MDGGCSQGLGHYCWYWIADEDLDFTHLNVGRHSEIPCTVGWRELNVLQILNIFQLWALERGIYSDWEGSMSFIRLDREFLESTMNQWIYVWKKKCLHSELKAIGHWMVQKVKLTNTNSYSHTTPIRIPKDMGIVWEAYHKGVPLLGVLLMVASKVFHFDGALNNNQPLETLISPLADKCVCLDSNWCLVILVAGSLPQAIWIKFD